MTCQVILEVPRRNVQRHLVLSMAESGKYGVGACQVVLLASTWKPQGVERLKVEYPG
jgi:hypothetical protein